MEKQGQMQTPQSNTSKAAKMKEKRKDLYQPNDDPYLKSLQTKNEGSIPQYINIHKFLESRSYELKHFTNIRANKLTSKLEH